MILFIEYADTCEEKANNIKWILRRRDGWKLLCRIWIARGVCTATAALDPTIELHMRE